MSDIVLSTINARYSHASFGLRWLKANLGAHARHARIIECVSETPPAEIAEKLLVENPRIIGLGVYIWNIEALTRVAAMIKAVAPEVVLVVGGPEVSHEYAGLEIVQTADYLVRGEGERLFAELADAVLSGRRPPLRVLEGIPPDLDTLAQPYDLYSDEDIAHRLVYVESSRGCAFRCDFCLSSLDPCVREHPLPAFLDAMRALIDRGVRQFKFVDRTFNLRGDRACAVFDFFLTHWRDGMRVHAEIVPDRLQPDLLERMRAFPPGGLHLEAGVQSFHPKTLELIRRPQDIEATESALRFLRTQTGADLHADLVAGLPGESWETFRAGYDRLSALDPHVIQVGILKRLRGAPIARHEETHGLRFSPAPPYEILATNTLGFAELQRIRRLARCVDLFRNSGRFPGGMRLLTSTRPSTFDALTAFSEWLFERTGKTGGIALARQAELLHEYLTTRCGLPPAEVSTALAADFHDRPGRRDHLAFEK
jgi:radical SAM superfamily enzyme YgiQ (UPF0313 family)